MISRALAALGLLILTTAFACSDGESDGAAGGSGGTGQGGTQAQAGSSGSGAGKAGSASAGTAAGGTEVGEGGDAAMGGTEGGAGDTGAGGSAAGGGGAAPGGDEVIAECLDAPVIAETRTEALQFSGAGLTLAIARRVDPDAFGTSGTTVWLPQRFGLVRGAVATCISEVQDLDYTVSHHNFDDAMSASYAGQTWIFKQTRQEYGFPAMFSLEGREGNTLVWGPVTLTLVSCQELLSNDSCAPSYEQ